LIQLNQCESIVLESSKAWLDARITTRFDSMLRAGVLDECRAAMLNGWDPALQSSKVIGAQPLITYLCGEISFETAREQAISATIRYAKRQRTWLRRYMTNWTPYQGDAQA